MLRRPLATLLLAAVAGGLLAPAGALAQANPFTPLPPSSGGQTQTPTVQNTTTTADDGGLDRWQEILIFIGGVVLVVGIGYAILRDAKRRAPVADERAFYREGAAADPDPLKVRRKAKARKMTKAQRQARRHNR